MMKIKILLIAFIALSITSLSFAQTEGDLIVNTTTSETGGNYAPKNVVAIWIEDEASNFVKTLLAYAQNRKTHLNTWQASTAAAGSEYNTVDAITGATRNSHATRTCTWNATDFEGNLVPDGNYTVWMELTDKNATGNFSSFSFTKGEELELVTPLNVPSFASISIDWLPSTIGISDHLQSSDYPVYPNPASGTFSIKGENITEVDVRNTSGVLIYSGAPDVDISSHPKGVYFIEVKTNKGSLNKKIIIN